MSACDRRVHHPAVALHDQQFAAKAALGEALRQALDVAGNDRLHVGVECDDGAALEFADLRQQFRTNRHVFVVPQRAHEFEAAPFIRRIRIRMEEVDSDRVGAACLQGLDCRAHAVLIQRQQHFSIGIGPFAHLDAQFARDQRFEFAGEAEQLRARAARQFQHVAEASGRDQAAARTLPLQHRVGRRGGAVDDRLRPSQVESQRRDAAHEAERLVARRRRHLGDRKLARIAIEQQEIGKRAADVHAQHEAGRFRRRR